MEEAMTAPDPARRAEELTDLLERFGIIPAHGLVRLHITKSQNANFAELVDALTLHAAETERRVWKEAAKWVQQHGAGIHKDDVATEFLRRATEGKETG